MIDAINHFTKDIKKHIMFLAPLGVGAVAGILVFSVLIDYTLTNFSLPTCGFFAGLVAGSIPLIYGMAKSKQPKDKSQVKYYIYTALAFALVIFLSTLKTAEGGTAVVGEVPVALMLKALIGGAIACAAMIVPGISGSFMLVLLGLYNVVIGYVALVKDFLMTFDFTILVSIIKFCAPLGIGMIAGAILFAKAIEFLMAKHHTETYYIILGLILGSLIGIFLDPIAYGSYSGTIPFSAFIVSAVTAVIGFAAAMLLGKE
jgi:putative membrane protein